MMKTKLLTLLFAAISFASYAQSIVQQADRAFASGKYSDATQLYEMAASTIAKSESERKKLYDSANKCRIVVSLHSQANKAYDEHNYAQAMDLYNKILRYNSKDQRAADRLNSFNSIFEDSAWKQVEEATSFKGKVAASVEYLKQYPNGKNMDNALKYISEEKLWEETKSSDTYSAYQNYMERSNLKIYLNDARKAISIIDEKMWQDAKNAKSKEAYMEYLNFQKDKGGKYLKEASAHIKVFEARELYFKHEYEKAYEYFMSVKDYLDVRYDNVMINDCLEYIYYTKASSPEATSYDCQQYLDRFTSSESHYYQVKTLMMKALCKEGKFDKAVYYARTKDDQKYIKQAKKLAQKKAKK